MYPGYVVATAASLVIGKPVKWVESRTENLISTGFARDYHMKGELALTNEGRILGLRVEMLSDQGAFYADAQPTQFKRRAVPRRHRQLRLPGRARQDARARTPTRRPAASRTAARSASPRRRSSSSAWCRRRRTSSASIPPRSGSRTSSSPSSSRTRRRPGSCTTPATTPPRCARRSTRSATRTLREEQRQARDEGRLIGIGIAHFTEAVGAGPSKKYDIARAEDDRLRRAARAPDRQGDPQARREVAGPGPRDDVRPDRRRRARHPVERHQGGGGRHRQHAVRARHLRVALDAGRRRGDRDGVAQARRQGEEDRRAPARGGRRRHRARERQRSRWRARPTGRSRSRTSRSPPTPTCPTAWSTGSRACTTTTRRTSPIPYGSYVVVVEVDAETGVWKVRRMVALDDCGVRINPMIVEGQIHGGLTEGFAMSSMQWITFDEDGNCIGSNFMDYLIPTAWETPQLRAARDVRAVAAPPDRRQGRRRVGDGRLAGRVRERGDRRGGAPRRAQHRHAAAPRPRVVGDPVRASRLGTAVDADVLAAAVELTRARAAVRAGDGGVAAGADARGTSARRAIVLADGTVRGWLGGACAEPTVVREALASLVDGAAAAAVPRLARRAGRARARRGMITIPMACESEGAMEIYLEPFLPAPQLVVIGRSPAVHALTVQARSLGWDVAVIDDGGAPTSIRTPSWCGRRSTCPGSASDRRPRSSSPPRATTTTSRCGPRSTPTPATSAWSRPRSARRRCSSCCATGARRRRSSARVHAPAGLDLGPVDNAEIAVAVLADLVARRAAGQLRAAVDRDAAGGRRPRVRHDRVRRPGEVPHRARRHRLLVLRARLPAARSRATPAPTSRSVAHRRCEPGVVRAEVDGTRRLLDSVLSAQSSAAD